MNIRFLNKRQSQGHQASVAVVLEIERLVQSGVPESVAWEGVIVALGAYLAHLREPKAGLAQTVTRLTEIIDSV